MGLKIVIYTLLGEYFQNFSTFTKDTLVDTYIQMFDMLNERPGDKKHLSTNQKTAIIGVTLITLCVFFWALLAYTFLGLRKRVIEYIGHNTYLVLFYGYLITQSIYCAHMSSLTIEKNFLSSSIKLDYEEFTARSIVFCGFALLVVNLLS